VIGLWPVALRKELREAIVVENCSKVSQFSRRYKLATAVWPDGPPDPFFNVNTPGDLAEAEQLAGRESEHTRWPSGIAQAR
jgi:molybdenum cofactor guanylyltransferase